LEPCYHNGGEEENKKSDYKLPLSFRQLGKTEKSLPVRKRMFGRAWPYKAIVKDGYVPSWPQLTSKIGGAPPCYVSYFTSLQFNFLCRNSYMDWDRIPNKYMDLF
jgi:serine carboxypeptidase-like clade 1